MSPLPRTIAIDGPAAAGKTSVGRALAERLGYLLLDTGMMYRAATLAALKAGVDLADEDAMVNLMNSISIDVIESRSDSGAISCSILVNGEDVSDELYTSLVDANVSVVAAHAGVRKILVEMQRRIGKRGRVVMIGRDIGTVVMPDADLKFYLDASPEVRARRRYKERHGADPYEAILADMRRRDTIDSTREVTPLRAAPDAIVIDTTDMSLDAVIEAAWNHVKKFERETNRREGYDHQVETPG